jgi:multidrug efflux system membrane fusion protein
MRTKRRLGLLAGVLSIIAVAGCDQKPAPVTPPPAKVTVARPLDREVIDWDEYTGFLAAVETVELRARVGGFVEKANFEEGQFVNEGQVLFELDPQPYQAELDKAVAQVGQAEAQFENAASEFTRIERLRAGGGGSEKEFQDARYNKMQANAAVAAAKANAESTRLNLDWTKVKAPIHGRISRKFITPGNLITGGTASGTLLTTITKTDPVYCYVDADERSVLKYQKLAQEKKRVSARDARIPAFLALANETGYPHEGVIDFVDTHVDPTTGTLRARGVFPNPNGLLLPGFFARLRIPGSGRYRALLVPDSAIDTNQNIKFLRVLSADDKVTVRPVKLGSLFGEFRVIEEGLNAGDRVVINGLQRAIPNTKVNPTEVALDVSNVRVTAPGSAATQALPSTRMFPASAPSGPGAASAAVLNTGNASREGATQPSTHPAGIQPQEPQQGGAR